MAGMGFYAATVEHGQDLEKPVEACLSYAGPALLNVRTSSNELIIPPTVSVENVNDMALYTAKAILEGRSKEVLHFLEDAIKP